MKLEPNQKLEEITWKDDSLWYLTRPMTDDDVAETHTFRAAERSWCFRRNCNCHRDKGVTDDNCNNKR